ncbi:MAG TPA: hypothetical protein VMG12_30965, partial [Polyangiaceae bacterium]|nr:hypothetical protein [Polyangiaceae bacterium]
MASETVVSGVGPLRLAFAHFLAPLIGVCFKRSSLARQDSSATAQTPFSDKLVGRAPARAGQARRGARQPDLARLLRRTLAALERDVPALRAAEVSRSDVAAFLAEQLAELPEPSAPASGRVVSER